ncbi:39S ribosomal protein L15, mitochondrial [Chelonus insularis]|uniref:39S ribosomal protein L15, mitochondrial n=1 Tax=Chelonus insularis TaxID=460826 RepID=UPI00158A8A7C|nr:39S ribosomal protein L15, mitochondrial [Chelonus insularis]
MVGESKSTRDFALKMLKSLPRVSLGNLRANPGTLTRSKRGRGQHGGDKHGAGNKGCGQRQKWSLPGFGTDSWPFHLRFGREPYYKGFHLRRQYPPLSLHQLQMFIDTNRVDVTKPIDLGIIMNTGLFSMETNDNHAGIHLTIEGADIFKAKVNIEVQWTSEPVIAAIEKNGGTITTAFYDRISLDILRDTTKFFARGEPIPRRFLPPLDCLEFYSNPATRGYLADPQKVSYERLVLAQKYGYELPKLEDDPLYDMLTLRKDPRQIFYGLSPGWIVSVKDKVILKPTADYLKEYYTN